MATTDSKTNDASYVAGNQLADAAMFIQSAMRLIEMKDDEVSGLLDKALAEIIAAQDFLEAIDPVASPIDSDVASLLKRIGRPT